MAICRHWASSFFTRAENDAGLIATAIMPSGSRKAFSSGVADISLISRFRRSTRRSEVPAGAKTPTHVSLENPGTVALNGGNWGNAGCGCVDVTASPLTFPDFRNGESVA